MHCPGGNATGPIWRVLASSLGITSWTPLKPQHSNPNPNPLANQLWCIDFLTPPTPLIIPHRLPAFLRHSKTGARFMQDGRKAVWSIPYVSVAFFSSLKQNFFTYRSSKESSRRDCMFEIHQLWQSGFSSVYSNCCCSYLIELEIIKIGQSSQKMYINNIVNFQESTIILNAFKKCLETYWRHHVSQYLRDNFEGDQSPWNCSLNPLYIDSFCFRKLLPNGVANFKRLLSSPNFRCLNPSRRSRVEKILISASYGSRSSSTDNWKCSRFKT